MTVTIASSLPTPEPQIPHDAVPRPYSAGTTAPRSPVLVVSIDGLAPRHITRATMPALTTPRPRRGVVPP